MTKKYIVPLLLCILMPSIQAEPTEQLSQVELAEQIVIGIVDDVIAFAGGCVGAPVAGVAAGILSRCMTDKPFNNLLAGFGGIALYGVASGKLAMEDGQKKKMFGRGGLVAATVLILSFIPGAIEIYYDPSIS